MFLPAWANSRTCSSLAGRSQTATPPTWMEQINYAVPRTNPAHGARQQAVADATQALTRDPLRSPQARISDLSAVRTRFQRAAQMCFPADGPSDPGLAADAAAKRRLHSQQSSGEPDSSGTFRPNVILVVRF
jgi:hypothetical protein